MSPETLEAAYMRLFESPFVGESFTTVWHSGEPLVAGLGFFESALEIAERLRPSDVTIRQNIQTNATLLNDSWGVFLRERDVRIGVSLDGPAFIHDLSRRTRRGEGTHRLVMRGIDVLRRHGVRFHVIAVLGAAAVSRADEIWDFFLREGITEIAFNFEEQEGQNQGSTLDAVSDDSIAADTARLFDRYLDHPQVRVREFDGLLAALMRPEASTGARADEGQTSRPMSIVSVDVDGNFSTFSPELLGQNVLGKPFFFGNVHSMSFEESLASEYFLQVAGQISAGLKKCLDSCRHNALCRGGCPSNKYFEHGTFDVAETRWCRRAKKAMIDTVLPRMEEILESATLD